MSFRMALQGKLLCVVGAIVVGTLLSSCATRQRMAPLPTTFLSDVDMKSKQPNLPYGHSWISAQTKKANYQSVYFKPIRIDTLPKDQWTMSKSQIISTEQEYFAHARELADYFHSQLIKESEKVEHPRLKLAQSPGPNTVVVEIVLTELEFSHPIARAATLVAPVPGAGIAVAQISDPHVAFAARLTDGATGKLIATAADRKFAPIRIIDLNKLTVTSSPREICAHWADTISQSLQSDGLTEIEEQNFSWLPW